jgi:hypothetical protein
MKKFLFGLTPLLAVAAFAVMPAGAQAARENACWQNTEKGPCITKAETIVSRSDIPSGRLVLTDTNASSPFYGVYVSCIDTDVGTVGTGGKDSITSTTFSSCTTNAPKCTVTAKQLSTWTTQAEKETVGGVTTYYDTITIPTGEGSITFSGAECVGATTLFFSGKVSQTWTNRGATEAGDSTFTNAPGLTLSNGDSTVVNGTIEIARSFGPPVIPIFES